MHKQTVMTHIKMLHHNILDTLLGRQMEAFEVKDRYGNELKVFGLY